MLQLSGFECSLKQDQNGKYYEFKPKQTLKNEFLYCDLFIQSSFLRKHCQEISKQKLLFVCESEIPLWQIKDQSDEFILTIASQLLKAVYVCHQHKIPGRCFNINNILWNKQKKEIVLMEFGLAPEINIYPPEYLDPNQKCYGIEIDQFLIGSILYYFVFQKPLTLNSNNLEQQEKQLQNELNQIQSPIIKKILQGLLNFKFDRRMKLYELGTQLGNLDQKILEFYQVGNIDFKRTCTIIDQKIYFREAENPVFKLSESLIFQTEITDSCFQINPSKSKKFSIYKIFDVDFTKIIQNYQAAFKCFDDSISVVMEFNEEINSSILIGLFALQKCKLLLQMQLRDELKNKNSKLFLKNPEEQALWEISFNENQRKFTEISQQLERKINTTNTSNSTEDKLKQVLAKIKENEISYFQTKYNLHIKIIGNALIQSKTLQDFSKYYSQSILLLWRLVEENLDFTIHPQKSFLLRIQLFFCAFSDYFCKAQDINYIELMQQLENQQFNPNNYISKLNMLKNQILNSQFSDEIKILISGA